MHKASRLILTLVLFCIAIYLITKALTEIVPVMITGTPTAINNIVQAFNNTRTWFLEDKITTDQKSEYAVFFIIGGIFALFFGFIVLHSPDTNEDPLPSTQLQ